MNTATNAVQGPTTLPLVDHVSPAGSFTDPEYAQAGLTEKKARETHEVVIAAIRFDSTTRTINNRLPPELGAARQGDAGGG